MKRFGAALLATAGLLAGSASVQACCWWPFGWGGGYGYSAPTYGTYSAMYAPAFPVYSASYAPVWGDACCAPVCCDPCGCGNNCASGACAGTNSSNTGTLKPQIDNNFSEPAATYDKAPAAKPSTTPDAEPDPRPRDPRRRNEETFSAPATRRPATTPADDFGTSTEPAPFGADNEISNKPPLPELNDPATPAPADKPAEGGDSFQPEVEPAPASGTAPQASRPGRTVLAERSSQINEVLRSPRLATRTAVAPAANRSASQTATASRVRWISAPMAEGHQRL